MKLNIREPEGPPPSVLSIFVPWHREYRLYVFAGRNLIAWMLSMDVKPLAYHPNRCMLFYRRPDLLEAAARLDQLRQEDRNWCLMSIVEMGGHDEDALNAIEAASGLDWSAQAEACSVEFVLRRYLEHGHQTFDVSRLVEAFRHTDVDSVVPGEIPLPFKCFYLHFGDCRLPSPFSDTPIEGCYVYRWDEDDRDALVVTAVCRHPQIRTLGTESLAEAIAQHGRAYEFELALPQPVGEGLHIPGGEDEEMWAPFIPPLVNLVVNSLCYMAYSNRDVELDFQPGAPAKLVEQTKSSRPTEVRRAESKLSSLGYTRIHFCGRRTFPEPSGRHESNGEMSPHWRRGHWRNQAHGPGRREHKWMWIAPTMVRADRGEAVAGHVYEVAPRD